MRAGEPMSAQPDADSCPFRGQVLPFDMVLGIKRQDLTLRETANQINTMKYENPIDHSLTPDELGASDEETQLQVMEAWFRARFEDPAESTPYDSGEGGYQYIWGGPYEANDVIQEEFSGIVEFNVMRKLIEKLNSENWEWAPIAGPDDYDE